jgi:SAM-dependent methyltransferase
MRVLHLGCGQKRWGAEALFAYAGLKMDTADAEVVHLDADARLKPDIVCRIGREPIPLPTDSVDIVLAWHVLEHIGQQGESAGWFKAWEELYRVLKPSGLLYGESPYYTSIWAWSDPTHTRVISEHSFVFFSQGNYRLPDSAISPYRIRCDFQWASITGLPKGYAVIAQSDDPRVTSLRFALVPKKPFTGWWEALN